MRSFTIFITLLGAATYVAAHGYVQSVTADGQTESGWLPWTDPYTQPVPVRVIRKIPNDGPVMDVSTTDIACNKGGNVGTNKTFDVNAGSDITFQWTNWPLDHKGPFTTFMASCDGDCSSFTASDGTWFKIDQGGYTNGQWASDELIANGDKWTSTIPAGVPSGQYLVRYELVALHSTGQPQYYPGCVQVNVKNGGADQPTTNDLTSFPGMYNGVQWPNIYTGDLTGFTVPGPNLVSFADGSPSNPVSSPSLSPSVSPNSFSPPSSSPSPSVSPNSFSPPSSSPSSSVSPNSFTPSSTISPPYPTSTPANSTSTCRTKKKRSFSGRHAHRRSFDH